jgi:hypothetical protein
MSLNRALTELFKVVREEAAGNPAFALKLEEALSVYRPSKALKQAAKARLKPMPVAPGPAPAPVEPAEQEEPAAPGINPISIYTSQGEAALRTALAEPSREALAALVEEHNLDPAGEADGADRDGLIEQIVSQARKRVERDSKLFDY